ncbi:DEAD/DEAH box helicase family protein [bacterium]|nr:DEAD/DEAH box helicase family protein [bacterium]MDB9899945.1 DEAD/DEAH box helicase family protein [bacterium]
MLERTIDQIINESLLKNTFGEGFAFRDGQREIIEAICNSYIEDPNATLVVDAPTGAGKSLIAMWSAHVLKELGNRGYLITSDLSLQDQYESDFYRLGLRWPSIRGVDNYECSVNGLPFSLGDCKLKGMGYEQAEKLSCYSSCDYLQNRKRSIEQPIALLNYSFWLIQRNYVEDRMLQDNKEVPFKSRDFVFFDEAHKVDEIVQGHFSPRIDIGIVDRFGLANRFIQKQNIGTPIQTLGSIKSIVTRLLTEKSKPALFEAMQDFRKIAKVYRKAAQITKAQAGKRFKNREVPRDWATALTTFDRIKDVYCKFDDYVALIKDVGVDSMVINQMEDEAKFMCVEEGRMIQKYLHDRAGFKVFMSATIGDPRAFVKIMGIKNAKFIRVPNAFNYDKSPVVFVNRHKLSFREREASLPKVVKILDQIISKHSGQRGVIHTGSYMFANYIKQNSKHTFRLMDYENSKDKKGIIELFKKKDDAVLMGPSLLEGLDLKDDISRFQIFFKVPYPNVSDPLIKAKMQHSKEWYDWKTGISIMQGVGRSVRSKDDWAVTYVLDACFRSLINKKGFFPPSFQERIKTIN